MTTHRASLATKLKRFELFASLAADIALLHDAAALLAACSALRDELTRRLGLLRDFHARLRAYGPVGVHSFFCAKLGDTFATFIRSASLSHRAR
eukprot:SAG11_NODE_349_length_10401_cov_22.873423_8_plen_94_part_00